MDGEWWRWVVEVVAETLLSSAVLALIGWGAWVLWGLRGRWLWRLRDHSRLTVVVANSVPDAPEGRGASGEGQIRALAYIAPRLARSYPRLDLLRLTIARPPLSDGDYEGDLLVLGGPLNNEVARRLLDEMAHRLPGRVRFDGNRLRWDGRELLVPQQDDRGAVLRDYGLIVRMKNPWSDADGTVILLAGCHTPGSAVAAKAFLDLRHRFWSRLPREFAAVVQGRIDRGAPRDIRTVAGPEPLSADQ